MSLPVIPPAPARLSTTIGTPRLSDRRCETLRAAKSAMPPGANGTTMRIGFDGYACCACAHAAASRPSAITIPRCIVSTGSVAAQNVRPFRAQPRVELRRVARDLRETVAPRPRPTRVDHHARVEPPLLRRVARRVEGRAPRVLDDIHVFA